MKRFIIAGLLLFSCQQLQAQFAIGAINGIMMSGARSTLDGKKVATNNIAGMWGGLMVEYGISQNIFIQTAAYSSLNGFTVAYGRTGGAQERVFRIRTLDIPLCVLYKTGLPGNRRLYVGGGPYLGMNLNGAYDDELGTDYNKLKIGENPADIVPLCLGATGSIGCQFASGVLLRLTYQHGLSDLIPAGQPRETLRTNQLSLGVGFFLGNRKYRGTPAKRGTKKVVVPVKA